MIIVSDYWHIKTQMLEATWVNVDRTVTVLILNVMNNVFQCSNEKEMRQLNKYLKFYFEQYISEIERSLEMMIKIREIFGNDD